MKRMEKVLYTILVFFTCIYASGKENTNGISVFIGSGDMHGNGFGINTQYQIQINKTRLSFSPFLGLGWTGSASASVPFPETIGYALGCLGEYGRNNKIQIGIYYNADVSILGEISMVIGYHFLAENGITFYVNLGNRYRIIDWKSRFPAISAGIGFKF
jgi:hypothetical protein